MWSGPCCFHAWLRSGGVLSVVLQIPSASTPAVTPTTFVSLRSLESLFRFVEPGALVEAAHGERLALSDRRTESLAAGKAFEVLRFVKLSGREATIIVFRSDIMNLQSCGFS